MKQASRILKAAHWLLFSKHEKAKEQILKYAEYTIEHTELSVSYDPSTKNISGGIKFKQGVD